jgi:hypothetical protein
MDKKIKVTLPNGKTATLAPRRPDRPAPGIEQQVANIADAAAERRAQEAAKEYIETVLPVVELTAEINTRLQALAQIVNDLKTAQDEATQEAAHKAAQEALTESAVPGAPRATAPSGSEYTFEVHRDQHGLIQSVTATPVGGSDE